MAVAYYIDPKTKKLKIMSIQGYADPNTTYTKEAVDKKTNTKSERDVSVSVNTDYLGMVRTDGPLRNDRPQSVNYNLDLSQSSKDKINNAMAKKTSSEQYSTEFKESSAEYKFNNGATNQNATVSPIGITARGSSPSGGANTEYKANAIHNVQSSMSGSSDVTLKFPSKSGTYTLATTEDVDNVDSKVDTLNEALTDEKMLGWTVPEQMTVRNSVSGNQFTKKVNRVDMSKLSWYRYEYSSGKFYFYANLTEKKPYTKNVYQTVYAIVDLPNTSLQDKQMTVTHHATYIYVRDDSYTNTNDFVNSLKEDYFYYELATPITMQIDGNEAVENLKQSLSVLNRSYTSFAQAYIGGSAGNIFVTTSGSTLVMPCRPNTSYRIIKNGGNRAKIACHNVNPQQNNTVTVLRDMSTSESFDEIVTTTSNAQFLLVYVNTDYVTSGITVTVNNEIEQLKADLENVNESLDTVTNAISMVGDGFYADKQSASSVYTAVQEVVDSLPNDGLIHIGQVVRSGRLVVIAQKYKDASYASAFVFGYGGNIYFLAKQNGTWVNKSVTTS